MNKQMLIPLPSNHKRLNELSKNQRSIPSIKPRSIQTIEDHGTVKDVDDAPYHPALDPFHRKERYGKDKPLGQQSPDDEKKSKGDSSADKARKVSV